jgi:chromosome segregation protein
LDITGFKSFMDHSVFQFDEGITGIVGPNGCGKSNVVDAVRWAMGEQSAKHLRGRGMEDVIFSGSESRSALSMAEVSLTLQIDAHDHLGAPYGGQPQITVTRRLFRDGLSEYLINKVHCRLLDITELFLGTGVGTRAYSIIEQGRVGLIVSAKPEDRRAFIEEAAGVTKYKGRRKAAERKMEFTEQNLLRITDVVAELTKQLDALARQAKKTEKYRKLRAEMREIELHQASHRFLELHAQLKVLRAGLDELNAEEQQSLARVRQDEDAVGKRRLELDQEGQSLTALQQHCQGLENQVQLDSQNLAHWEAGSREIEKTLADGSAEDQELRRRGGELDAKISEGKQQLERLGSVAIDEERAMRVAEEEVRRLEQSRNELTSALDAERATLLEIAARLANQESNLTNLFRRRAELHASRDKQQAELRLLRGEEGSLEKSRQEISKKIEASRQLALQLAEQRGLEEDSLRTARQAFAENEIQLISVREELSDKRGRLSSLQEIQRNYEGYDRGVRAAMRKAGAEAEQRDVYGLVAEVISVPAELEKAIEAALGDRLQHVIVKDRGTALELIEFLRSEGEGRCSFIPSSAGTISDPVSLNPAVPGVIAWAPSQISCEERFRPIVNALLGQVVIVSDLAAACEYAQSGGGQLTLVTLEGTVVAPNSVTGGTLEGPAVGSLQKKREIGELENELSTVESRYNELLTRHYELQKAAGRAESVLKGLAKHQHSEEMAVATQEKDLHRINADLARIRERLASVEEESSIVSQQLGALDQEEHSSRGEIVHGQSNRESREASVGRMVVELEAVRRRAEEVSAELTAHQVRVVANSERKAATDQQLEQLASQRNETQIRLERIRVGLAASRKQMQQLATQITETISQRDERTSALELVRGEYQRRQEAYAEATASVRDQESRVRDLRERLDELTHGLSRLALQERELSLELGHLVAQVRDRHQVELEQELHRFHLLPQVAGATELRVRELRQQVERMGEVNLTAAEEHAELSKRHQFLSAQRTDLEASLEQLKRAIARIDRTSRERFAQAFEAVNEKFQQVFPRLFGGGRAGLVLVDLGPGLEPGVDIVAQPPGKKLQNVNLLSGGEKALTAVSLIFSIFLIKPTPFCILDEVDAPLDEANVSRYNELVREMSHRSQFILITHNKKTMEGVDTLYGVTMEEPGVSKLVSVRMRDAAAANDSQAA